MENLENVKAPTAGLEDLVREYLAAGITFEKTATEARLTSSEFGEQLISGIKSGKFGVSFIEDKNRHLVSKLRIAVSSVIGFSSFLESKSGPAAERAKSALADGDFLGVASVITEDETRLVFEHTYKKVIEADRALAEYTVEALIALRDEGKIPFINEDYRFVYGKGMENSLPSMELPFIVDKVIRAVEVTRIQRELERAAEYHSKAEIDSPSLFEAESKSDEDELYAGFGLKA